MLERSTLQLYALLLTAIFSTGLAQAAQQTVTGNQDSLLDKIEAALPEAGVTLLRQARTDHFALVYARHGDGAHVTLTLRQLPQDDTRFDLTVASDSPRDAALERNLLRRLTRSE